MDQVVRSLPDRDRGADPTVHGMITRRTYLGEVKHGEHVNREAHEPIITEASGVERSQCRAAAHRVATHLLSALVRCAGCGWCMRASSGGKRKPAVCTCTTSDCPLKYTTIKVDRLDDS